MDFIIITLFYKEDQYKVKTLVIDVDFCANPEEIYPRIEKKIQGLEIGVLVNNVGMSYVHAEYLVEVFIFKNSI